MNGSDKVATDLMGPFDSRDEVLAWMKDFAIEYRPNAEVYERAILYAGEMTDGESAWPWGSCIHERA
jgi:hypothetical protein